MDYTTFAHLRPKERVQEFSDRVRKFISECPIDSEPYSSYWHVIRYCSVWDWHDCSPMLYQSATDQYRVRTKVRRFELRFMLDYLPSVDVYGNEELEAERERLIADGVELVGIFDAIIKACSAKLPTHA